MKEYPSPRQFYADRVECAVTEIAKELRTEKNKSPLFKKKIELTWNDL